MPDVSHIGKRYEAPGQVIEAPQAAALAQAIAGDSPVFAEGAVPPSFAAVYCLFPTLGQLFMDEEVGINLAGLVHGEQSFEWPAPVYGGDVVDSSCEIASVEEKRGLTFVGIDCEAIRQSDKATVCRGRALMIIRGA